MLKRVFFVALFLLCSNVSFADKRIIQGCLSCNPIQKTALAKQVGADLSGTKIRPVVNDVYIFSLEDSTVFRYKVTSTEKWIDGEPTSVVTVVNVANDFYVESEVKSALRFLSERKEGTVDSTRLDWGGYTPITSAHQVVQDLSYATQLRRAAQAHFNPAGIRSDIFATSLANAFDIGWSSTRTIQFPDGTTIKVKTTAILEDAETGEVQFEIAVDTESAKDGDYYIPTGRGEATGVPYQNMTGEQLDRFLATAAAHGIPISNQRLKLKVCWWDGTQVVCRATRPR